MPTNLRIIDLRMTDSVPEYNWNNVEEQNFNPRMSADRFGFF